MGRGRTHRHPLLLHPRARHRGAIVIDLVHLLLAHPRFARSSWRQRVRGRRTEDWRRERLVWEAGRRDADVRAGLERVAEHLPPVVVGGEDRRVADDDEHAHRACEGDVEALRLPEEAHPVRPIELELHASRRIAWVGRTNDGLGSSAVATRTTAPTVAHRTCSCDERTVEMMIALRSLPWKLSTGPTLTPPLARMWPRPRSSFTSLWT